MKQNYIFQQDILYKITQQNWGKDKNKVKKEREREKVDTAFMQHLK